MNKKIYVSIESNEFEIYGETSYELNISHIDGIDLSIITEKDKNIGSYLKMNKGFIDFLKEKLNYPIFDNEGYDKQIKKYISEILKGTSPFRGIEYIYISFDELNDVREFLNNNPSLKNKKIVLNNYMPLDINCANKLKNTFDDMDNIFVLVQGNTEPVNIEDYISTINLIEDYTNKIKKYDLSPFEQIIYAYDLARSRFYVSEGKNEKYSVSRDLTSVLTGDKIVCVGFAIIFYTILNNLGIKINEVSLYDKKTLNEELVIGHARNSIYIKDDKYDIDGIYVFDPTWDNKKDDTNNFLNSFKFFAKTIDDFKKYENNRYSYMGIFSDPIDVDEIKQDYEEGNDINHKYSHIGILNRLIDGKNVINELAMIRLNAPVKQIIGEDKGYFFENIEDYFKLIEKLDTYLHKSISVKTFLEALLKVRKIEYYDEPEKYPFDEKSIYQVALSFPLTRRESDEEKILSAIFGKETESEAARKNASKEYKTFNKEVNVKREVERVRFADALRTYTTIKANSLRESFENSLLKDNIVENYNSKTIDEIMKLYGSSVSNMIGYKQENAHHCYDLWNHTLHTVKNVNIEGIPIEDAKLLKVAAFFHDVGKPNVSKYNEQTGQQVFHGHASESIKIAEPILRAIGYNDEEINKILFYIKHHDDFISYKNSLPMYQKNHIFLREINVNTIAEKIIENMYDFKAMGYTDKQIRYICFYLINDKEPKFSRYNETFVDMNEVIEKIKSGEYNYSYLPSKEDYLYLLELCRADAKAQSDIAKIGDNITTKKDKLLVFDKVEYDIEEAFDLVNNVVLSLYKTKKETK